MVLLSFNTHLNQAILDPSCTWSYSQDQAAESALNKAESQGKDKEYGGVLFRNAEGEFCYSAPVGSGHSGRIAFTVPRQPGLTVVGLYHTHPGDEDMSEVFSPEDVYTADRLNLVSYIKSLASGIVRRYRPGISPTEPRAPRDLHKISRGEMISRDQK